MNPRFFKVTTSFFHTKNLDFLYFECRAPKKALKRWKNKKINYWIENFFEYNFQQDSSRRKKASNKKKYKYKTIPKITRSLCERELAQKKKEERTKQNSEINVEERRIYDSGLLQCFFVFFSLFLFYERQLRQRQKTEE